MSPSPPPPLCDPTTKTLKKNIKYIQPPGEPREPEQHLGDARPNKFGATQNSLKKMTGKVDILVYEKNAKKVKIESQERTQKVSSYTKFHKRRIDWKGRYILAHLRNCNKVPKNLNRNFFLLFFFFKGGGDFSPAGVLRAGGYN